MRGSQTSNMNNERKTETGGVIKRSHLVEVADGSGGW